MLNGNGHKIQAIIMGTQKKIYLPIFWILDTLDRNGLHDITELTIEEWMNLIK